MAAALTLTACGGGATDATDAVKDERNAAGEGEQDAAGEMLADSLRLFQGASSVQVTTRSAVAMGPPWRSRWTVGRTAASSPGARSSASLSNVAAEPG